MAMILPLVRLSIECLESHRPGGEYSEVTFTRAPTVYQDRSGNCLCGVCSIRAQDMSPSRIVLTASLFFFSTSLAFGCSCSNSTPIQHSFDRYRDRAVFTAHVVPLMGKVYNWDGRRRSSQVLAIVKERYWGLPWYWPKVVMLDGSYPCDIAMEEGQDYLVSGHRWRYGVLGVNGCSRTQPLEKAQVDLRTLDGSHCVGPGGT